MLWRPPRPPLFPYTTLFRSLDSLPRGPEPRRDRVAADDGRGKDRQRGGGHRRLLGEREDALFDRERPDLPDVHAQLVHRDRSDGAVVALEPGPALRELVPITLEIVGLVRQAGCLDARLGYEDLVVP